MTKDELLAALRKLEGPEGPETEERHMAADDLLVTYIDDQEVAEAYYAIEKWYS